jgi:YggT family protein
MTNVLGIILTGLYYLIFILIFARMILSWVNFGGYQIRELVFRLTEPLLAPVRKVMPATQGIDFSPMIVLFLTTVIYRFILGAVS